MIDREKLYKKFCERLPKDKKLSEEQKKQIFEFFFKICYQYLMNNDKK